MENLKPSVFQDSSVQRASVFHVVEDFITTRTLEQRSRRTLKNYRYDLADFAKVIGPETPISELTTQNIKQYLLLSQQKIPKRGTGVWAHRARYNTLRGFLRWCVDEGYVQSNLLTVRPPKMPHRIMPVFSDSELKTMLDACELPRDRAILLTLLDTGMRLGELVGMKAEHIDWDDGTVSIIGKGDKQRIVVLSRKTLLAIYQYLKVRRSPLEEIWLSEERRPLTHSGAGQVIRRLSKKALGKVSGPHKFRHTFACNYLANGGSIDSLQYILGHSSLKMVIAYAEATKAQRARDQSKRWSPVERLLG